MFQIDNSTAVAAIPAPTPAGSAGYFTDGNPATGVSATILPAEFMNMLMMENMNVLSAAGITPAKGQYNQLALAIAKIVQSGAAGPASEATAGILKLATSPQALAGTDDSTAITPLKLAQKLANFLGQATEDAFGWLKIATQALVNAGADDATAVTPKKLAVTSQSQVFTAFTAGGTAPAFTLKPTPAISAYANQRFQVTFGAAGGATPTMNISGKGALNLKQYSSSGAKVAAVIVPGQTSDVFHDGTDLVVLDQAPNSTGVTAAQFDNSVTLATTAFVNGVGFQFSSIALATANATLTAAAHAGAMVVGNSASAITLTLPAASTMPAKALIKFWNLAAGAMTLTAAGADNIFLPATNTTFVVPTGAFITLASNGSNGWYAVDMSGLGVGQAWADLTGSRASGTTYTNSTGRAITVVIQGCNAGTVSNKNILVNGSPLFIMYGDFGSNLRTTVSFVVPNGSTYSATISTLQAWSELR